MESLSHFIPSIAMEFFHIAMLSYSDYSVIQTHNSQSLLRSAKVNAFSFKEVGFQIDVL